MSAATILTKELKELSKNPIYHITLDNDSIFHWTLGIYIINPESIWHHAYLQGKMTFPSNYPFSPPTFQFSPEIFHPNVYNDGRVCISILHEAGSAYSDEPSCECWSPAQRVESVLMSIISILDDPNISSPANVDASTLWRDKRDEYNEKIKKLVKNSYVHMPDDFKPPSDESVVGTNETKDEDDWYFDDDSDDDDDDDQMSYDDNEAEMSEDYDDDENDEK